MKLDLNLRPIDAVPSLANITHNLEASPKTDPIDNKPLKNNIRFAKKILKKTLVAADKFASDLPHYLIIGPPKTGKTTLLASSGITFFEQDKLVQKTPEGLTTVSHSNWWVTENAVFIDVPGYYLDTAKAFNYSASNPLWNRFLRLLKRNIKLSGVIITIDIPSLIIDKNSQPIIDLMQIRLHELAKTIGYPIPVQLIFTKVDIIQGFIEFFDDLSHEERELSWGIAFSQHTELHNNLIDEFTNKFDQLLQRLNERVIHRLHQEHSINKKSLIKNFCLQFAILNDSLRKAVFQLNAISEHYKNIFISGVFFCSSKQGHQTKNLLLENFATNFKLTTNTESKINIKDKPYFVKAIFIDLLKTFHKKNLKSSSSNRWLTQFMTGSLLLLTSACCYLFYQGYKQQRELLSLSAQAINKYELTFNKPISQPKMEDILFTLDILYNTINQFENTKYTQLYSISGYQPNAIKNKLSLIYTNALQNKLYPMLKNQLEQSLAYLSNNSLEDIFKILKTYLMLNNINKLDTDYITKVVMGYSHDQTQHQDPTLLAIHLKNALASLTLTNTVNDNLVQHARQILNSHPEHMIAYMLIKNNNSNPLKVNIAGKNANQVFDNTLLLNNFPRLFTQQKFADIYQVQIPQIHLIAAQAQWIFGNSFRFSNSNQLINTLRKMYLNEYLDHWQGLSNELMIKPFLNYQQAISIVNILANKNSPLYLFINSLINNNEGIFPKTLRQEKKAATIDQILSNKKVFIDEKPKLTTILTSLAHFLQDIADTEDPAKTSFTIAIVKFRNNLSDDIIDRLSEYAKQVPFPLNKWLNEIALNTWALVLKQATHYINLSWQQQIIPFYQAKIANKYPINRDTVEEININDFNYFFSTTGIINTFFNSFLLPFTDINQAEWRTKTLYSLGLPISKTALLQLERAFLIQKMFFNDKGTINHQYRFELIAATPNVHSVTLTSEKQILTFKPDSALVHKLQWSFNKQLTITIQDYKGRRYSANFQGPWALLRFLDKGKLDQTSDVQHYDFEYEIQGHIIKFSFITDQLINPFINGILEQFTLDEQL